MKRPIKTPNPRLLVFDDDPLFLKILAKAASEQQFPITLCQDMSEFALKALENNFDVAVIDYNLDTFKGSQVAKILESQPAVVISQSIDSFEHKDKFPDCVKAFVSKTWGTKSILQAAKRLYS